MLGSNLRQGQEGVLDDRDDAESVGVLQIANDVARDMERLREAFDAERWLARGQGAQQ